MRLQEHLQLITGSRLLELSTEEIGVITPVDLIFLFLRQHQWPKIVIGRRSERHIKNTRFTRFVIHIIDALTFWNLRLTVPIKRPSQDGRRNGHSMRSANKALANNTRGDLLFLLSRSLEFVIWERVEICREETAKAVERVTESARSRVVRQDLGTDVGKANHGCEEWRDRREASAIVLVVKEGRSGWRVITFERSC